MARSFTPEELQQLRNEWNTLTTVEERLNFWQERIRFRYSLWSYLAYFDKESSVFSQSLSEFYIKPSSHATYKEETECLNLLILKEIKVLDSLKTKKELFDFEELKTALDEKISDSIRPLAILNQELEWVDKIIEEKTCKESINRGGIDPLFTVRKNYIVDCWLRAFRDYYIYGKEVDYTTLTSEYVFITASYNGNVIAKFKEYIELRIKNPNIKKISAKNKETTLKQQLLMLRFLGFLEHFKNWKQKDRDYFLATLLNRSPQNIKEAFSYLYSDRPGNEIWTENNLEFLIEHFSKIGLNQEVDQLKINLDELKNKLYRLKSE